MHFDFTDRIFIYTGHAIATQGESILRGNVITAYQNKLHQINKVISIGKPAYFEKSNRDSNKPPLQSKADTIIFYPIKHLAILKGHAWAKQGEDEMTGHILQYNTETEILIGKSQAHHQLHMKIINGRLSSSDE